MRTLQQLSSTAYYAPVVALTRGLGNPYENYARTYLPVAAEAAETMLPPEEAAKLCGDVLRHLGAWSFGAFEKFPRIFDAARNRLSPHHAAKMLGKLAARSGHSMPFTVIDKLIRDLDHVSPKQFMEIIAAVTFPDGCLTYRSMKNLTLAFDAVRPRMSSNGDVVRLFQLLKRNGRKDIDKVIGFLPHLMEGMTGKYAPEDIVHALTRVKVAELSPAGNALLTLYRAVLFRRGELNSDLAEAALFDEIRRHNDDARAAELPTIGGKLGGDRGDFIGGVVRYLEALGFEYAHEVVSTGNTLIKFPVARSAYEATILIDMMRELGLLRDGAVMRHQITLGKRLEEEAKYIALALHSSQTFPVPFPPEIRSAVAHFKYIAPVVDGGGVVNQINGKSWFGHWRFDIPLLRLYVLNDEKRVLKVALAKDETDRSLLENVLVALYEKIEEVWAKMPTELTLEVVPDEALAFIVHGGDTRHRFLICGERVKPDLTKEFFAALEKVYGEDLSGIRANHEFNIYASQMLTWALKSTLFSEPWYIFRRFKERMHARYRAAGIEDVLHTKWMRREWHAIYPSLARLEAAEGEDFRRDMRTIVRDTVVELQRLVK